MCTAASQTLCLQPEAFRSVSAGETFWTPKGPNRLLIKSPNNCSFGMS